MMSSFYRVNFYRANLVNVLFTFFVVSLTMTEVLEVTSKSGFRIREVWYGFGSADISVGLRIKSLNFRNKGLFKFFLVEGTIRICTNNYGSGSGRHQKLQLRVRNTAPNITFFYSVTSFRDEEYRTELESGDEFIQVSVTSPHKVKLPHQREP